MKNILTKEKVEKYKLLNNHLTELAEKKVKRSHKKKVCFWCEIEKPKFPRKQKILCPLCFISPLKEAIEKDLLSVTDSTFRKEAESELKNMDRKPSYYAKKYEKHILLMIRKGRDLSIFLEAY